LADCEINYAGSDQLAEMLKGHLPDNWESSIHLQVKESGGISLFGIPTQ
jgi:hypothetical protein